MDDFDPFERGLASALRSDADMSVARFDPGTIAAAAMTSTQPRSLRILRTPRVTRASDRWRFAVAAVIGVVVIGGAFLMIQGSRPALVGGPSPTPSADSSPSQPAVVVVPSATPTATPSPTPTPILWTQASLEEDWPGPVRTEPAGGGAVQPIIAIRIPVDSESCCLVDEPGRLVDPSGDTESDVHPWVDIRELELRDQNLKINLVSKLPPDVDFTEQWIAYGVVFDDDRDGVPDRRIGIDNSPRTVAGHHEARDWITDLHNGRTVVSIGDVAGGTFMDNMLPGERVDGAWFKFGGEAAGGGTMGSSLVNRPLYAWASVIQDGRVVATDFAPDIGWLDLSVKTKASDKPQVESSPAPTARVVIDPDVPGGRLWTVTVVNDSAKPAALVVAEETNAGLAGRLVGTVTPSVVPAGATLDVIFALPPGDGWSIFVNPGPDMGPLLLSNDAPLAGEIRIREDGQIGWSGP